MHFSDFYISVYWMECSELEWMTQLAERRGASKNISPTHCLSHYFRHSYFHIKTSGNKDKVCSFKQCSRGRNRTYRFGTTSFLVKRNPCIDSCFNFNRHLRSAAETGTFSVVTVTFLTPNTHFAQHVQLT